MLALQRHRQILEKLGHEGSVRVVELAKDFGITEETIRRDLEKLEKAGQLERSHGGAVPAQESRRNIPLREREVKSRFEKESIARAALALVRPNDLIVLDASSTALQLARLLAHEAGQQDGYTLTVLTNSMAVLNALHDAPGIEVIGTGGRIDPDSQSFTGEHVRSALEQYHVDCAFISCKGLDLERGMSEVSESDVQFKRWLLAHAQRVVMMADSSKWGMRAKVFWGTIQQADVLITDSKLTEAYREAVDTLPCDVQIV